MTEMSCPWCEASLALEASSEVQTCPECLTVWSYDDDEQSELALAA